MHYVWQNTNWTEFRWKSDALIQPLGRIWGGRIYFLFWVCL